jgi:hypothetical protein
MTFDFLGFAHICARCRKDGRFALLKKTMAKRLRSRVEAVTQELERTRHVPMLEQGK